ncbi:MAG: inositol monophosphatase [Bacteroidaceae bacterium]|nr:inositol monophosphatase [Bacteroidaceae bacterium]
MRLDGILEEVKALAVKTGAFIAEQRKSFDSSKVESKRSHDYVSYVDEGSEQMIVARLKEILPEAGFITEEKTVEQVDEQTEYFWVVDPLDGTTNFIHDLAPYCVCIALRSKTEILLGVVYEVTRKELYSAAKGMGAYLNDKPIHVTGNVDLDQALVMIGYPYDADAWRQFCLNLTGQLYGHCASIRSNGSAEAELCYVASGKIDVYIESFIQPWDVAAGACILMEAGGKVTDYDGKDEQWESGRQVIATNGWLHDVMLQEIAKAKKNAGISKK